MEEKFRSGYSPNAGQTGSQVLPVVSPVRCSHGIETTNIGAKKGIPAESRTEANGVVLFRFNSGLS